VAPVANKTRRAYMSGAGANDTSSPPVGLAGQLGSSALVSRSEQKLRARQIRAASKAADRKRAEVHDEQGDLNKSNLNSQQVSAREWRNLAEAWPHRRAVQQLNISRQLIWNSLPLSSSLSLSARVSLEPANQARYLGLADGPSRAKCADTSNVRLPLTEKRERGKGNKTGQDRTRQDKGGAMGRNLCNSLLTVFAINCRKRATCSWRHFNGKCALRSPAVPFSFAVQ